MNETQTFKLYEEVVCNGYEGYIKEVCSGVLEGMYVVRLQAGETCVSGADIKKINASSMKCYFNDCSNEATELRTATEWIDGKPVMQTGYCAACKDKLSASLPQVKSKRVRPGFRMDKWKSMRGMI